MIDIIVPWIIAPDFVVELSVLSGCSQEARRQAVVSAIPAVRPNADCRFSTRSGRPGDNGGELEAAR
ncbi:MAG: hypothetical protein ACRYG4_08360 [Janthinobacterium lividum]